MQPTPEQQVIIDFAVSSKENLLIRAFAGTAKTTTLEFIARALPIQPILCLAFNKRIAEAMTQAYARPPYLQNL
jgi:F-box protein 18 (helicase)